MRWNEAQQCAISAESEKILVSAAAGSGKTAVLVERIKKLILEKGTGLDEMLIVTFTNAAAGEMRQKIVSAITAELEERDDAFLRRQLDRIHKAEISTFHAFALNVIRSYSYTIGLEPGQSICDDAQRKMMRAEACNLLFEQRFNEDYQKFTDFLLHYSSGKNEDELKEKMIFELYDAVRVRPDSFAWLAEKTKALAGSREDILNDDVMNAIKMDIYEALGEAVSYARKAEEILMRGEADAYLALAVADTQALEMLQAGIWEMDYDEMISCISDFSFKRFVVKDKEQKEKFDAIKDVVTRVRDSAKGILKKNIKSRYALQPVANYISELNDTSKYASYLYDLIMDFHRLFTLIKREKSVMDFADVEHYALEILLNEEVANIYRRKFKYIFIDEYQDSNVMQETLIARINQGNSLFMVGDVKQSIYKFRLAEPEIFLRKYESYSTDMKSENLRIDLNMNYRSKKAVIDGVNDVFFQMMKRETCGMDYDEAAALKKGVEFQDEESFHEKIELHILDDKIYEEEDVPDGDISEEMQVFADMKRAELEANVAAELIKNALYNEDGTRKVIYDAKRGQARQVMYRDIVILFRNAKSQAEAFYNVLSDAGIPTFVNIGEGYFDTLEIETFMNLLRVIDNRRQDIPLLSIMYSPMFGFKTEELIKIRLIDRSMPFYEVLFIAAGMDSDNDGEQYGLRNDNFDVPAELRAKCKNMLKRIQHWHDRQAFIPLDELVWDIMNETGYYIYAGALPGGKQRQANLRALADKALDFQSTHIQGLFGFISYIESIREKVDIGQVRMVGESEDVVRIMTVHKSKGLEFPIVILAGLGKNFIADKGSALSIHKDVGISLRWTDETAQLYKKTLLQHVIERKKAREDRAEEIRILYVAFTRAMDKLILLGTKAGGIGDESQEHITVQSARSYLEAIMPMIAQTDIDVRLWRRTDLAGRRLQKKRDIFKIKQVFATARSKEFQNGEGASEHRDEIEKRLSFVYQHESALKLKSKYAVSELDRAFGDATPDTAKFDAEFELAVPLFAMGETELTAAEKGTVLHKVMELLPFKDAFLQYESGSLQLYLRNFIGTLVNNAVLTQDEADTVDIGAIEEFISSDIGRRAACSDELRKETPFVLEDEVNGEKIVIQGIIDCYFKESEKYVILDYKSNRLYSKPGETRENAGKRVAEQYRTQLTVYKNALEKIKKTPVNEMHVYLLSAGLDVLID